MKSEKGITLISLTIYIIVMSVMIAAISLISNFFYTNINDNSASIDPLTQHTKFNSFFSDEVNHNNIKVLECQNRYFSDISNEEISFIAFDNGVQYEYVPSNKGIYRNNVKICENVNSCEFYYEIENGKEYITVNIRIGDRDQTTNYTLKK